MKRITSFVPTHPMYSTVRRAGTEACPYDWLFKIRKALDRTGGQHLISHPVRADTAVRPYAEVFVHRVSASSGARCAPEAGSRYRVEPNAYT